MTLMDPKGLADRIVMLGFVRLGRFRLSSGRTSSIYVDLREYPMHPREFREALRALAARVRAIPQLRGDETLAGVATGGIAWAVGAALLLEVPATYVRPGAKDHGTSRLVEAEVSGRRIVLVDDVATTGSSLERAAAAVEDSGGEVVAAVVVVDRLQGARERLASIGVPLYSLVTLRDLVDAMMRLRPGHPLLGEARREVGV